MSQVINTNIASMNSQRNLVSSGSSLASSLQRISSGLRINSAKDDAAGLAISQRMTAQIKGLNQATRNANDGISMAQTAEGALNSVGESLQRMRELAVQASNATNSTADRAALQGEVDQLVEQINTVASQTSFNGIKLLDGTFNSQSFQVGANKGETISISSIASAKADSLGVGTTSSYQTKIDEGVVSSGRISSGGITVNGYGIGPSVADGVSYEYAAVSTGTADVPAVASERTGGNIGAVGAADGDDITFDVNGYEFTVTLANSDSIANVKTKVSDAFDAAKATGAAELQNITLDDAGADFEFSKSDGGAFSVSATGSAALQTAVGFNGTPNTTETGTPLDAGLVDISFGGEDLNNINLGDIAAGTTAEDAAKQMADTINTAIAASGMSDTFKNSVSASVENGRITITGQGGDIVIGDTNAVGIKTGTASAQLASSQSSAISKAAAFNAVTGQTGVSAKATATTLTGDAVTTGAIAGDDDDYISVNGVKLGAIAQGANAAAQANNTAAAINAVSNQTGVTATFDSSGKITMTAADGRNIALETKGTGEAVSGLASGTTYGGLTLNSTSANGITLGGADLAKAGLSDKAGTNAADTTFGTGVSTIDISTADGAQNAIATIDAALQNINSSRASLGAVQNRFGSVASNLQTSSENVSAARSRIMDADFAAETANLSRAQILQQAGTAMLSQANSIPQNVLSLLR
ncbi:flagellin [Aromatoleum anaerobium]|uniref:Flagellin n=2 Tax=Aromatoleum TaxID=551759 RepID=A0ABX1PFL6_9RHOO|nr:flagellin [Aromatoleum anaerobium]MCK0509082.1 hypothetical protein [Aromatoleum anaerobium]